MLVFIDDEIPSLDSEEKSPVPAEQATSENLPKNVSMQLFELMAKVTEKSVTPATVRAACQCAAEIHKILDLNYRMSLPPRRR